MQVWINNINLHYCLEGDRDLPVLVFINSLGTDFRIWDDVVSNIKGKYCILRYDKRSHGLSDPSWENVSLDDHVRDLSSLLSHLQLDKVNLCGLSIGGLIAQAFAKNEPERVISLTLSNTAAKIGQMATWNDRMQEVTTYGLETIADGIVGRWFSEEFRTKYPHKIALYRNMLMNMTDEGYISACIVLRDTDLTSETSKIIVPTLCIAGREDVATPLERVIALSTALVNAKLRIIESAGHMPNIEQPEKFSVLIDHHIMSNMDATSSQSEKLLELGMDVRKAVLGASHVARAETEKTEFDRPFQEYITRSAWGSIWSRRELSKREKSLMTISILAALGYNEELAMHIRATRNTGASKIDVREVLLHTAIYAGVPAANDAFRVAKEVYQNMETEGLG